MLLRILLALQADPSRAYVPADELKKGKAPQSFVRLETFPLPKGASNPAIVYGNKEIGYFVQRKPLVDGNRLAMSFLPPTYRAPVEFRLRYADASGKTRESPLGSRRYTYPGKRLYEPAPAVKGRFSFPFVLVNAVTKKDGRPLFFPAVLNTLGEVVWYAFGQEVASPNSIMFQKVPGGYLFLHRLLESKLIHMDFDGTRRLVLPFSAYRLPINSHAFRYFPETNSLIYLSFDCRQISRFEEVSPVFNGLRGVWNLIVLPRRTYRGNTLVRLDLSSRTHQVLWNAFDDFGLGDWPSLNYGRSLAAADRFLDVRTPEDYLAVLAESKSPAGWNQKCHVDWMHANSVDYAPGQGYLISIRNLNLLAMVSERGALLWTLGESSHADFRLPKGTGFAHQHSASFLPNGDILLFDNNSQFRGFTGNRMFNRVMVLEKPRKGEAPRISWTGEIPALQSQIRGSTEALPNGNFFVYVPGRAESPETIFEMGPNQAGVPPRMKFGGHLAARGIEARPVFALGTEEHLKPGSGGAPDPSADDALDSNLEPARLIDTTY